FVPLDGRTPAAAPRVLVDGIEGAGVFTFSSDGKSLAYTRRVASRLLWLVTLDDPAAADPRPHARPLPPGPGPKVLAGISPDGTRVAYVGVDGKRVMFFVQPLDGVVPRRVFGAELDDLDLAWSPDGDKLAFLDAHGIGTVAIADGHVTSAPMPSLT